MCEENIWSDENLELMFQNMSEEEIKEFWNELEKLNGLAELIRKGYSFSGGPFSKSVFVYKSGTPLRIVIS